LREFLSAEQGFLLKAESLLLCIAKSMDDSEHPSTGPYYPDVIELVSELLKQKVREQIFTLPEETLLCPGHGPLTTVAIEKANNPFF